ncbi:hypothetical protein RvY_03256-2 [Ramazzottius varieornatus]|uniref:Transposase Helix-turn-helix domain-containing protein n=1 Tax=Ramazzottius varieornatus TaxID=947166 RepID=A0A1D1UN86_RAMVA|nr:hypothetical protein RvY_03256-2 [Ramazzottius varieornatus]
MVCPTQQPEQRRNGRVQTFETNPEYYEEYFRMTEPQFKLLLKLGAPLIVHDPTHIQPITAEERLVLTLRILATGISQTAAAHSFAICQTTIGNIFKETTKAIYTALKDVYIRETQQRKMAAEC